MAAVVIFGRLAMDEQKRDQAGRFGSGGGGGGSLKSHPQYTESDHAYLKDKGWSDQEIKKRWDEEHAEGNGALTHKKAPDIVGHLFGKDEDIDHTTSMSGEAGRQARKLARDCMSGRFRQ